MQISSRFTIAIHVLTCMDYFKEERITSDFLAGSVQTNPVIIRKIMEQLKAAGMIEIRRGRGGASLSKSLQEITLYDVFHAVESLEDQTLFHFHENPNTACPVGRNIHAGLDDKLESIQQAMEDRMKQISVGDVAEDAKRALSREQVLSREQALSGETVGEEV